MSSVMDLAMRNSQALGVVLTSRVVNPAVTLLQGATGYWDVANYTSGSQTLPNRGTGGSALDAQLGSTSSVDSNDPQYLAYSSSTGPYVYLPGVAGNYMTVPDAAGLTPADIDILVRVLVDSLGANRVVMAKRAVSSTPVEFSVEIDASGHVVFRRSYDGATWAFTSATSPVVVTAATPLWVRVSHVSSTGALTIQSAADSSSVPSSWTTHLSTTTATGTPYDSTANLAIGDPITGSSMLGNVYRAIVRNGIGGSTVLDVDTSVLTSGSAASFTAVTGQTVTINRASSGRKAVAVVRPCMLFGTDDYLQVADNDLLDFGATEPMSALIGYRMWATAANYGTLLSKGNNTGTGWLIHNTSTNLDSNLAISDGTNAANGGGSVQSSGAPRLVTSVIDRAAQTIQTYTNATPGSSASTSAVGNLANSSPLRVGVRANGTAFVDMEFLFAAVFRRALSASEISLLATYAASRMP